MKKFYIFSTAPDMDTLMRLADNTTYFRSMQTGPYGDDIELAKDLKHAFNAKADVIYVDQPLKGMALEVISAAQSNGQQVPIINISAPGTGAAQLM